MQPSKTRKSIQRISIVHHSFFLKKKVEKAEVLIHFIDKEEIRIVPRKCSAPKHHHFYHASTNLMLFLTLDVSNNQCCLHKNTIHQSPCCDIRNATERQKVTTPLSILCALNDHVYQLSGLVRLRLDSIRAGNDKYNKKFIIDTIRDWDLFWAGN